MQWVVFAGLAAFIEGFETIFKKKVLKKEHTFEFLSLFYLVSFLLLIPLAFKVNFNISANKMALIVFRSFLLLIAMVSFTKALRHLPLSTVGPFTNFNPLFVLVLAFIFLSETIGIWQFAGIILIVIGSFIVNSQGHPKHHWLKLKEFFESKYVHYMILFSVSISLVAILSKILLMTISPITLLFHHAYLSVLMYLTVTFLIYDGLRDLAEGWEMAGFWIILIAIMGMIKTYTTFLAYESIDSMVVLIVPIIQLSAIIDVIAGGKIFKEEYIGTKVTACLVMITGVILLFL